MCLCVCVYVCIQLIQGNILVPPTDEMSEAIKGNFGLWFNDNDNYNYKEEI